MGDPFILLDGAGIFLLFQFQKQTLPIRSGGLRRLNQIYKPCQS